MTPLPLTLTLAPAAKFVPVNVTGTFAPCTPLFGFTEVSVTEPPNSTTEYVRSPIVMLPVNCCPWVFGATLYEIDPDPAPDVVDMIVIHGLLLAAVRPHSGVVLIDTLPDPPLEANDALGGEKVKSHVAMMAKNASSGPPPNVPCRGATVGKFEDAVAPMM